MPVIEMMPELTHPDWCVASACGVTYDPLWTDRPVWVGDHSTEPVVIGDVDDGWISVAVQQFTDGGSSSDCFAPKLRIMGDDETMAGMTVE